MPDYTKFIRTMLKDWEIYYPKEINDEIAQRLFNNALRPDITAIYDKAGKIFYNN